MLSGQLLIDWQKCTTALLRACWHTERQVSRQRQALRSCNVGFEDLCLDRDRCLDPRHHRPHTPPLLSFSAAAWCTHPLYLHRVNKSRGHPLLTTLFRLGIVGREKRGEKGSTWRGKEGWKGEGVYGEERTWKKEYGKWSKGSTWIFVQGPPSS